MISGAKWPELSSRGYYRAVYQFFAGFENNIKFGQKVFTGTDFRSKFVKKWYYLKISEEMQLSLVQYFYKLDEASSKIVLKVCCSHVLLKLRGHSMKVVWCGCCVCMVHGLLRRERVT